MRYNTKSRLRNRNRNNNNKPNRGSKRKPAKRTNSKNKRSRVRRRTVKGGAASEKVKTVTKGKGECPEILVIPNEANTKFEIPNNAFENCENLTSVTIESPNTKIGDFAFHNCKNLKEIKLPVGLEIDKIGERIFAMEHPPSVENVKEISSVEIPWDLALQIEGIKENSGKVNIFKNTECKSVTFLHSKPGESKTVNVSHKEIGIPKGDLITSFNNVPFEGVKSGKSPLSSQMMWTFDIRHWDYIQEVDGKSICYPKQTCRT